MDMKGSKGRWQPWMGIHLAIIEDGSSQAELAAQLGWDPSKVSRLATGKQDPKAWELDEIRKVQGRPLEWYFYGPAQSDPTSAKGVYTSSARSMVPAA